VSSFLERIVANEIDEVRRALAHDPTLATRRDEELGSTPLHFAAHRGLAEIALALLDAGADVNAREGVSDATPLHWAAEAGHPALARLLVERGASIDAVDTWYELTPLGWATVVDWAPQFSVDRPAAAAYLRQVGALGDVFVAIAEDDAAALRAHALPGALERRLGFVADGQAPLHLAITRARPALARLCVELDADVRARTASGLTPLALAFEAKDAATAALLHERGVRAEDDPACALVTGAFERLTRPDDALLFLAAERGLADAVRALSRAGTGANVRFRRLAGERPALLTPLHVAAGAGHLDTVRALLDAGADVDVREEGFAATPLGWAESGRHDAVAALLRPLTAP
jgi:ankyrin repeat protein